MAIKIMRSLLLFSLLLLFSSWTDFDPAWIHREMIVSKKVKSIEIFSVRPFNSQGSGKSRNYESKFSFDELGRLTKEYSKSYTTDRWKDYLYYEYLGNSDTLFSRRNIMSSDSKQFYYSVFKSDSGKYMVTNFYDESNIREDIHCTYYFDENNRIKSGYVYTLNPRGNDTITVRQINFVYHGSSSILAQVIIDYDSRNDKKIIERHFSKEGKLVRVINRGIFSSSSEAPYFEKEFFYDEAGRLSEIKETDRKKDVKNWKFNYHSSGFLRTVDYNNGVLSLERFYFIYYF
ncbi:MAG: hypothetical protein K1X56_04340 [Flavobacteriales bacterium]|nr:hypothetical protein [Flavobacteriales bacterium]